MRALLAGVFCLAAGSAVGMALGLLHHAATPSNSAPIHSYTENSNFPALCSVLRPTVDFELLGAAVLPRRLASRRGRTCREGVQYEMGRQGLGHRVGNYAAGLALSLCWGLPPLIGADDADRCGPHGCYAGAEDALGLARGVARASALWRVAQTRVARWEHGTSLRAALGRLDGSSCNALWALGQDVWLRDLSLARPGLRAQMRAADEKVPLPFNRSSSSAAAVVAVHLRYGGSDFHKKTDEAWLRTLLLEELVPLARGGGGDADVEFHVYTGGARFAWLENGVPGVRFHGKELDAVATFRAMAHADVLVCGHSSLCFHAALVLSGQPLAVGLLPANTEPFPYDMCPGDLECVGGTGALTQEQRIRVSDVFARARLFHQYCTTTQAQRSQ